MKILRSIDQCIDSFEKRIFLFIFIFLCLYWLWQNVWQLILFGKLFFVTDYESLFHIQSTLGMYQSSVFIRILYYVISNPTLNVFKLISCIKIIYIFLTIFLYLLKCPQSLILSALRAFCFCGKPHISRSIFLYFRYQAWLKSW